MMDITYVIAAIGAAITIIALLIRRLRTTRKTIDGGPTPITHPPDTTVHKVNDKRIRTDHTAAVTRIHDAAKDHTDRLDELADLPDH